MGRPGRPLGSETLDRYLADGITTNRRRLTLRIGREALEAVLARPGTVDRLCTCPQCNCNTYRAEIGVCSLCRRGAHD